MTNHSLRVPEVQEALPTVSVSDPQAVSIEHVATNTHNRVFGPEFNSTVQNSPSYVATLNDVKSVPQNRISTASPTLPEASIPSYSVVPPHIPSADRKPRGPGELENAGTNIALGAVGAGGLLSGTQAAITTAIAPFAGPGALAAAGTVVGYTLALPMATAIAGRYIGGKFGNRKRLGATVGAGAGLIAGQALAYGATTAALTLAVPAAVGATLGGMVYLGHRLFKN